MVAILACSSGISLSVSLAIPLPWFTTSIVMDRVSRCTHVIVSQGVPLSAYWLGTFLANYLQLLIVAMVIPGILMYHQTPFYSETAQLIPILMAALMTPISLLLFGYN